MPPLWAKHPRAFKTLIHNDIIFMYIKEKETYTMYFVLCYNYVDYMTH